jgi:hypothetical protein
MSPQMAAGMWNSAKFVVDDLISNGREAKAEIVVDGNSVDAAVTKYNPSHVFIEGYWVTPSKMAELMSLPRHQGRTWIVRVHSEIPFLAGEGIAMGWNEEYWRLGVILAPNAPRAVQQFSWQLLNLSPAVSNPSSLLKYLPNCYPVNSFLPIQPAQDSPILKVACFGAFRILKNHLNQAFVAARFAQSLGKTLEFHFNGRVDGTGKPVIKNVKNLFDSTGITWVQHEWEDRDTFLQSLSNMDLLLQVSMSETFNIVAADATLVGIPILTSSEVPWVYPLTADPQTVDDCLAKLRVIWANRNFFITKNRLGLTRYANRSQSIWLNYLPVA